MSNDASVLNVKSISVMIVVGVVVSVAVIGLALAVDNPGYLDAVARLNWRPHWPHLSLIAQAALPIRIHLAGVAAAFLIGVVLLAGVKGTRVHRTLGWTWSAAMGTAAISSLFIHGPKGGLNILHFFTGWTLIALPMALAAARRHDVRRHARLMTGMFVGGLGVAGLFAFMPGRLMWSLFFG